MITIKLNESSVKDAISRVEFLKENIEVASNTITETLVNKGTNVATQLNAAAPQSGTSKSVVIGKLTENRNKGYIALVGQSAVYDEFGTGEEGQSDPHPAKDSVTPALKGYNTGPHIFYNQFANKYQWRYYPMAGKPYYTDTGLTSGIPSGKQMYNTSKYLKDIKQDVIASVINNATKRFR